MGLKVVATHKALQGEDSRPAAAAKPHVCPHATAPKVELKSESVGHLLKA